MLEDSFMSVYDKFVLEFFRRIFEMVREREGSLSAMEAFSVEVIHELREPTIGQFADFLNISQSNATYKINSLIKKGYIEKQNSPTDRREYHLILADKYYKYTGLMRNYVGTVTDKIQKSFCKEDVEKFSQMLRKIADELMEPPALKRREFAAKKLIWKTQRGISLRLVPLFHSNFYIRRGTAVVKAVQHAFLHCG